MKIDNLCIVVPIYQEKFSADEIVGVNFLKKNAYEEDIFFVAPKGLVIKDYGNWKWPIIYFPNRFFTSVDGYTKLLLSQQFYKKFASYEYMLICQPDALLLQPSSRLNDFIATGYDYFGAPWPEGSTVYCYTFKGISKVPHLFHPQICHVGNGGFSLRNIPKTVALLKEKGRYTRIWNMGEDCFFAYHGIKNKCGYRIAPKELAYDFAVEKDAKEQMASGRTPIGIHGWKKFYPNFFSESEFYV